MAILLSTALFGDEPKPSGRDFYTPDAIKMSIAGSKNFKLDGSDPKDATLLLLFDTRLQRTWLVKTRNRLYCVLDDLRTPEPNINWSMAMHEIVKDNKLLIDIVEHSPSETGKSGLVDIGANHKDWLYSTKLFTVRSVKDELGAFLRA